MSNQTDPRFIQPDTEIEILDKDSDGSTAWLQSRVRRKETYKGKDGRTIVYYVVAAPWTTQGETDLRADDLGKRWRIKENMMSKTWALLYEITNGQKIYKQWQQDKEAEKKRDAEDQDSRQNIEVPAAWKPKDQANFPDWAKDPVISKILKKTDIDSGDADSVDSVLKSIGTKVPPTVSQNIDTKNPEGSTESTKKLKIANVASRYASLALKTAVPTDGEGNPIRMDSKLIRTKLKITLAKFAGEIHSPLPPTIGQFLKYTKWLERVFSEEQAREILKKFGDELIFPR